MKVPRFVSYHGSPPILLPVSIRRFWRGFFLPIDELDEKHGRGIVAPDLELPEGSYVIWKEFDFQHPKTDYDRACAPRSDQTSVHAIPVGPGHGLVFSTELKTHYWWQEQLILLDGGGFPETDQLASLRWTDELTWQASETDFVLMNSCEHGAAAAEERLFGVRLEQREYVIQRAESTFRDGGEEYCLILHRFLPAT